MCVCVCVFARLFGLCLHRNTSSVGLSLKSSESISSSPSSQLMTWVLGFVFVTIINLSSMLGLLLVPGQRSKSKQSAHQHQQQHQQQQQQTSTSSSDSATSHASAAGDDASTTSRSQSGSGGRNDACRSGKCSSRRAIMNAAANAAHASRRFC